MIKPCRKCKVDFHPSDYQIRKSDYLCSVCRYALYRDSMRQTNQRRRLDPAFRAKQAEWSKAWREANARTPERMARKAEQMRGYAKDPRTAIRHKARRKVRHEIEMGRMKRQPCEVCGAEKSHAHHDDYNRPLDIRWLCPTHHREHHAKAEGEKT